MLSMARLDSGGSGGSGGGDPTDTDAEPGDTRPDNVSSGPVEQQGGGGPDSSQLERTSAGGSTSGPSADTGTTQPRTETTAGTNRDTSTGGTTSPDTRNTGGDPFQNYSAGVDRRLNTAYSDTGYVQQYVDEDQIVENAPTRQEFGGNAAKGLARFYAGATAADTVSAAGDAAETLGFVATGKDGELSSEDFGQATGFDRGDFAEGYVDQDVGTPESDEQTGRAERVSRAFGQSLAAQAEFYHKNPAEAGTLIGESVAGAGLASGVSAASKARLLPDNTRSVNTGTGSSGGSSIRSRLGGSGQGGRSFLADNRGQTNLVDLVGGFDSDSGGTKLSADDLDVDPGSGFDEAAERADVITSKAQRNRELREEFESRVPGGDDSPNPSKEFSTVSRRDATTVSQQDFRTASGGPDTSRSGPRQRSAAASTVGENPMSLGPGEGIKARSLETPSDDLRDVIDIEQALAGGSAGGSSATGASAGTVGSISASSLTESTINVGPEVAGSLMLDGQTGDGISMTGSDGDTGLGEDIMDDTDSGVFGGSGNDADTGAGVDGRPRFRELGLQPTDTGADSGTDTFTDTGQPTDTDTTQQPTPDTGTPPTFDFDTELETSTRTDSDSDTTARSDTESRTGLDTELRSDSDSDSRRRRRNDDEEEEQFLLGSFDGDMLESATFNSGIASAEELLGRE